MLQRALEQMIKVESEEFVFYVSRETIMRTVQTPFGTLLQTTPVEVREGLGKVLYEMKLGILVELIDKRYNKERGLVYGQDYLITTEIARENEPDDEKWDMVRIKYTVYAHPSVEDIVKEALNKAEIYALKRHLQQRLFVWPLYP